MRNRSGSPLALLCAAPLVGACHLAEGLRIDCVAGMPCAGDTGGDTSPSGEPTLGVLLTAAESDNAWARRYSPQAEELDRWEDLATLLGRPEADARYGGSVAWNPALELGVVAAGDQFAFLYAGGGTANTSGFDGPQVYDVALTGERVWAVVGGDVLRFDTALSPEVASIFDGGLVDARGIVAIGDRVYVSDCTDGTPDMYTIDADTQRVIGVNEGFSDNCGRGDNLFEGPDGEPWQCNASGVLYRVGDLLDGDNSPRYAPSGMTDVRDCGYDPGDGSFYFLDGRSGLVRLAPGGGVSTVWEPARGVVVGRANFFQVY